MTVGGSAKQVGPESGGKQVAVILTMKEYQALLRARRRRKHVGSSEVLPKPRSLYGALSHLGGKVASTEEIDAARREMWSAWDKEDNLP